MKELSEDKDFYSLPEIAGARGGFDTLGDRLNDTTAQLAQKANDNEVRKKSVPIGPNDISASLNQAINGNAPVLQSVADNMIKPRNTSFITSLNKFDKDAKSDGYIGVDGNVVPDSVWVTSDFIHAKEGDIIRTNINIGAYAIYGLDFTFIERVTGLATKEISVTGDAYYIKLQTLQANVDLLIVTKNKTVPAVAPYKEVLDNKLISDLDKSAFSEFKVSVEELDFTESINIFNPDHLIKGKYISYIDGLLLDNANYGYVAMDVAENTVYTRSHPNQHFAWFDKNNQIIPNPNAPQVTSKVTSPVGAVKIISSVQAVNFGNYMFVKGDSLPPTFTAYKPFIPSHMIEGYSQEKDLLEGIINLPSKLYGITGLPNNIYFDNVINKIDGYDIDVSATQGIHYDARFGLTSETPVNLPLSVSLNKDGAQLSVKSSTLEVKYRSATTSNFKLLAIGDSNTNRGYYTQKLIDLFDIDSHSNIELAGTRGEGTNKHEGRSGWSAAVYTKMDSLSGVSNAFWNPAKSDFDFAYYATQNSISGLTHVAISLGTNDIFPFTSDSALINGVPDILTDFDKIINSIKAYDSNLKIVVMLPFPVNSTQTSFGASYGAGMTRWRYKRNHHYFVDKLIAKYDNRTNENIYVLGTNLMMDTTTDFVGVETETTPAVHPAKVGLDKVGEQIYKFLKVVG